MNKKLIVLCFALVLVFAMNTWASTGTFTGPLTNAFLSVDMDGGKPTDTAATEGWNGSTTSGVYYADQYGVVWSPWGGPMWSGGDGGQLPQNQSGTLPNTSSITKTFTFNGTPSTQVTNVAGTTPLPSPITITISAAGTSSCYQSGWPLSSRDRGAAAGSAPNYNNGATAALGDVDMFRDFVFGYDSGSNVQSTNYLQVQFGGLSANTQYEIALYSYDTSSGNTTNWTATAPTMENWMGWWDGTTDGTFTAPADEQTITWTTSGPTTAPAVFTLTSDNSGNITVYGFGGNGISGNENAMNSYLNGIQIAPVPEPATIALLSLGGLVLLRRKRA
jgi:hypothetical protein